MEAPTEKDAEEMPGFVQLLEGLDGMDMVDTDADDYLGDLGDTSSAIAGAAVRAIVKEPAVQKYLYSVGQYIAKRGLGEITDMLFGKPKPASGSEWVTDVLNPIIDPIQQGALDYLAKRSRPFILGVATITGVAAFGLGALVARARRPRLRRPSE